jgi:hypothetical protein
MRPARCVLFGVAAAALWLAIPAPARAEEPSVQAVPQKCVDGRPPLRTYLVRLALSNPEDHPVWFVLPYWGDRPLPEDGVFPNQTGTGQPFGGKGYAGQGGPAVEVEMYGGAGFHAYRLPAKGRVVLDGYGVEAWKDVKEVVVLECRRLEVNGKTPLEKWLPYDTLSGANVTVGPRMVSADWTNLDWDAKKFRTRDDYPKEKAEQVKADCVRRWTIKVQAPAVKDR